MVMKTSTRLVLAIAFLGALMLTGCAGWKLPALPPILVPVPPPVVEPAPAPVPVPEPPPVVEPEPPPLSPLPPLVNLNIVVHDATGAGIPKAACAVNGEARVVDGSGFVNFAVRGPVVVACSAVGYVTRSADLPPGDHRFPLAAVPHPLPAPTANPRTPTDTKVSGCWAASNTGAIAKECLEQVAAQSANWPDCVNGSDVACHRYVREVALALKTTQTNPRWGLIKKGGGQSCTMTACGEVNGYGEDVVAYLPEDFPLDAKTWKWRGIDIVGGAGAPGARYQWGPLHEAIKCDGEVRSWCNREGDLWAPLP